MRKPLVREWKRERELSREKSTAGKGKTGKTNRGGSRVRVNARKSRGKKERKKQKKEEEPGVGKVGEEKKEDRKGGGSSIAGEEYRPGFQSRRESR